MGERTTVAAGGRSVKLKILMGAIGGWYVARMRVILLALLAVAVSGQVAGRREAVVGLGAGRASARFEFTMTDTRKGQVIWRKTIQATAAFFGSSGSSHGQRQELPERIAERLLKELETARRLTD